MDAFQAAMVRLFADPNLAKTCFYIAFDGFPGQYCRGILGTPSDLLPTLGGLRTTTQRAMLDILQSDIQERPKRGASIVVNQREWKIEEVSSDSRDLVWKLVIAAVPVA